MTFALEPCQSGIDRAVRHLDEAELVYSRHQLVSVRLALGKESEQDQPQNSLEELGVVLMSGAGVHNCMVPVIVKYRHHDVGSNGGSRQTPRAQARWGGTVAEPLRRGAHNVSHARHDLVMNRKELAYRQSDGLEISLLWDPRNDALAVRVVDARLGVTLELPVRDESPLEVFYHPFAVASRRGQPVAA
jgi:hypothetical protein